MKEPNWPDWLFNQAAHYLSRHAATESHLREILARKVIRKRHKIDGGEGFPDYRSDLPPEIPEAMDTVISRCRSLGYVNDQAYAEQRYQTLQRKGWTVRKITQDLIHKGVARADVENLIAERKESGANEDLKAAIAFARRKRFGAYQSLSLSPNAKPKDKQLAVFMRAGFRRDLAEMVLEADWPEDLLEEG